MVKLTTFLSQSLRSADLGAQCFLKNTDIPTKSKYTDAFLIQILRWYIIIFSLNTED